MNPLMLVTLLAVGLALFFAFQALAAGRRAGAEDKVMKGYFLLGLSGLMAKIAAADGKVTDDEREMAGRIFNRMELTDAERALCLGNFITARHDGLTVRDHARRFIAYANAAASEFLYDILWRLSRVDGKTDPAEDALLSEIATCLSLDRSVYENFKSGVKRHHDKAVLRAAGVPPSLLALAR